MLWLGCASCVPLGERPEPSEPQFLDLQNGMILLSTWGTIVKGELGPGHTEYSEMQKHE